MSEAAEIRAAIEANAAFYTAFAAGDADAMEALWATTTPVLCIHPGRPPLHGRAGVMKSWRAILEAPPPIRASGPEAVVVRGVALVTCHEHIGDATLAATNVFVWEDGAWRLAHHQAGLVEPEPPPAGPLH